MRDRTAGLRQRKLPSLEKAPPGEGEAPSGPRNPQAHGEPGQRHGALQSCSVNAVGCEWVGALEPRTGRQRKGLGEKGGLSWVAHGDP